MKILQLFVINICDPVKNCSNQFLCVFTSLFLFWILQTSAILCMKKSMLHNSILYLYVSFWQTCLN